MRRRELLELEVVAHLEEGGQGMRAPELATEGGVLLVEAAENVEDQCAVRDVLAEVTKGISHVLEPLAVVRDGEITLDKVMELSIEVEGPSLSVTKKL